jgi:sugar lactone lactonase YvrE
MIFPADRSLNRPESGVGLKDGRIVVADQVDGLRLVQTDGSSRPFGKFAEAGYLHDPPKIVGGPNGVTLEPSGTQIIVADVFRGGIYRVDVETEATELDYQHDFGVNMARTDRSGGIWFTQSTRNHPENGEAELWRAVETPTPDGALWYIPPPTGGEERTAVQLVDDFYFANGIALDEDAGYLYVAETMGNRVYQFRVDVAAGQVSNRTVVLDPATGIAQSVFRLSTPESEELVETIEARLQAGQPWLQYMTPPLWEPGPGPITGMILTPNDGPVYASGLGDALIRLER